MTRVCGLPLLAWLSLPVVAALQAQPSPNPAIEATPQRPSFSNDTSTTAPGTVELELGGLGSGGFFALPTLIKFTPGTEKPVLRGTEFSVGFDAVTSVSAGGERLTRFGDRVGMAVRRAVYRDGGLSFALAPHAVFFVRDGQGARLGAALLAVYQSGLNSLVGNLIWSTATSPSEGNPAQQYSFIAGYARTLGEAGAGSRFSVFGEYLQEFPRGSASAVSLIQGLSYRVRPDLVLDFAVQETGLAAGPSDVQIAAGLTVNLGRVREW